MIVSFIYLVMCTLQLVTYVSGGKCLPSVIVGAALTTHLLALRFACARENAKVLP